MNHLRVKLSKIESVENDFLFNNDSNHRNDKFVHLK